MSPRSRWVKTGADALAFAAGIFLVLMLLQIVLDVALKYVWNAPIQGNLEVVSFYYMVGVVFLPLALVELRHQHIHVDLFVRWLSPRWQKRIYAVGCLLTIVVFAILAYRTFLDALHALEIRTILMGSINVTIWPSRFLLPIGFLMALAAVGVHALRAARN